MSGLFTEPTFRLVGDRGLLVEYGEAIAPEINRKVRAMALALEREKVRGVRGDNSHLPLPAASLRPPGHGSGAA